MKREPAIPSPPATVLVVPGLRGHVAEHWQTRLAERLRHVRTVPPLTVDGMSRAARVAAIDRALEEIDGPVVVAAHSAGAIMMAHWARTARRPIVGALLATPADLETPLPAGYPARDVLQANGWLPLPRDLLPFPTIVAASTDDPLASYARVAGLAVNWGATLETLGPVGHLNPASGFGEWPRAVELLRRLARIDTR